MKWEGIEVESSKFQTARIKVGQPASPHTYRPVIGQSAADTIGKVDLLLETAEGGMRWYHIDKLDPRL